MSTSLLVGNLLCVLGFCIWQFRLSALRRPVPLNPAAKFIALPVSIIVPARNEAHNLPKLLQSLSQLNCRPLEIIVVDDHSSDATASVAEHFGARVVTPDPLPEGWLGKPWACRAGAAQARGDYLLFTDADTWHHPESLSNAFALLLERKAGLLSTIPTHAVESTWEKLQGVFQLLLLVATGAEPNRRTNKRSPRSGERHFCIGQYLLFSRRAYESVGGHEAVCNRVAEDLAFCRLVQASGWSYALLFSPGTLVVRMYPEGFFAFLRGWRRNFREGLRSAKLSGFLEVAAVIGWLLSAPIWLLSAALTGQAELYLLSAIAYLFAVWQIRRHEQLLGTFPLLGAALYPLFTLAFIFVSLLATYDDLRRAPVTWRGREVRLTPEAPQPHP